MKQLDQESDNWDNSSKAMMGELSTPP